VDRCEVRPNEVAELREGSLVRRIWAGIRVKCGNHDKGCAWIGSVADYKSHTARCINDMKSKIKLSVLKRHNADLLEEILEKNNEMNKLRISMRKLDPKGKM
jgi:hypothetical protein